MLADLRKDAVEVGARLSLPMHVPDGQAALAHLRSAITPSAVSQFRPGDSGSSDASWLPPAGRASKHVVAPGPRLKMRAAMGGLGLGFAALLVLGLAAAWGRMSNPANRGVLQAPTQAASAQAAVDMATATPAQNGNDLTGTTPPDPLLGKAAPNFTLTDVRTGQTLSLASLRGSAVVLTFWDTRCPPCQDILPPLQEVYNKVRDSYEVVFVSVTFNGRDTAEGVKEFLGMHDYGWTFLHDSTGDVAKLYNAHAFPTTYFIDKLGVARAVEVGKVSAQFTQAKLDATLAFTSQGTPDASQVAFGFVPTGKVRHLTYEVSSSMAPRDAGVAATSGQTYAQNVWLANGKDHLIMYSSRSDLSQPGLGYWAPIGGVGSTVWVDDEHTYRYSSSGSMVQKGPYTPTYVWPYLPYKKTASGEIYIGSSSSTGDSIIRGRPVMLVQTVPTGDPTMIYPPNATDQISSVQEQFTAIDTNTAELVQFREIITYTRGPYSGQKDTFTMDLVGDELLDRAKLPADFFAFKMPPSATQLLEDFRTPRVPSVVPESSTQIAKAAPTPEWYDFWGDLTISEGNFGVKMPGKFDQSVRDGEIIISRELDGVTYGVKYRDYPVDLSAPENAKEQEKALYLPSSEGKLLSEQTISLGAYPGKEFSLLDSNNNYLTYRIYIVRQRVYTVFAMASDQNTGRSDIGMFFNSFHLLDTSK